MAALDDDGRRHLIAAHFDRLWPLRDPAGWVALGIGGDHKADNGKVEHGSWFETHFRWPAERGELLDLAIDASLGDSDVYMTPGRRENPVRNHKKARPLPGRFLWADVDGGDASQLERVAMLATGGGFTVQSGRELGHVHLYVALSELVTPDVIEVYNRRLVRFVDGDPAPSWLGGFLRPAGTWNYKPTALSDDEPALVDFAIVNDEKHWSLVELAELLPADNRRHSGSRGPIPQSGPATVTWPPQVARLLLAEPQDRSEHLYAIVAACFEAGLMDLQALEAAAKCAPVVDKYRNRLPEEVERIWAKLVPEPVLSHPSGKTPHLDEVLELYQRWLWVPDTDVVVCALGAVVANLLPGDPLWLLVVSPGGSGKTETLAPLAALPYVHSAATLTEPALLSGTPTKDKEAGATGGLMRQVGAFGVLMVKDFSGVLSMHRESRAAALAALREVYDGSWSRPVGTGGGRVLTWHGKCGLIGAVTPSIDRHSAVLGALGERFVLYRLAVDDPIEQGLRRLANRGHEEVMRAQLAEAVTGLLSGIDPTKPGRSLTDEEKRRLVELAVFVVAARSPVERDGYSHDVVVMPSPEAPGRLVGSLGALLAGVEAVGADTETAWRIVTKTAWDCVPDLRQRLLLALHDESEQKRAALVEATAIPDSTCRRTLEDLALLELVEASKAGKHNTAAWQYRLTDDVNARWPTSPDTSGGGYR
jgi:hypothetical protein